MSERVREVCDTCQGTGRVVDERQAGEQVATCMVCRGNGWVYADTTPVGPRETVATTAGRHAGQPKGGAL